jgi:hypothetical protein
MYIEHKPDGIMGPARIRRVTFSRTGQTLYYGGKTFEPLKGLGFKCNYFDVETEEGYWISGCKKRGGDRLYPGTIETDDDVREEYWSEIRKISEKKDQRVIRCKGKYGDRHA